MVSVKRRQNAYVNQTLEGFKGNTWRTLSTMVRFGFGPIPGGEHQELVKSSTKNLVKQCFPMLALGSPC